MGRYSAAGTNGTIGGLLQAETLQTRDEPVEPACVDNGIGIGIGISDDTATCFSAPSDDELSCTKTASWCKPVTKM